MPYMDAMGLPPLIRFRTPKLRAVKGGFGSLSLHLPTSPKAGSPPLVIAWFSKRLLTTAVPRFY